MEPLRDWTEFMNGFVVPWNTGDQYQHRIDYEVFPGESVVFENISYRNRIMDDPAKYHLTVGKSYTVLSTSGGWGTKSSIGFKNDIGEIVSMKRVRFTKTLVSNIEEPDESIYDDLV